MSRSSGMAKTVLQGTVKGARRRGRQKKRWEYNIKEWTGMGFGDSLRAEKDREGWKGIVATSSVVPRRPQRLRDWDEMRRKALRHIFRIIKMSSDKGSTAFLIRSQITKINCWLGHDVSFRVVSDSVYRGFSLLVEYQEHRSHIILKAYKITYKLYTVSF